MPYAASGSAWLNPQQVTLSFVPDGTIVGTSASGPVASNLFANFNTRYGSTAAWQNAILRAAQVWAQQTNLNFTVVSDNGGNIGSGLNQQGDPNFGDIRIGGYGFSNTNLAQAILPPPSTNFSAAGDMQFNTNAAYRTSIDLFTVAAHEFGHSLGLLHTSGPSSAIMWGSYNGVKTALAADDINGIRFIYGGARSHDSFDLAASNDSSNTATDLTSTIDVGTGTTLLTSLDITTTTDVDYFKFTVPVGMGGTANVRLQSQGLSLLAPTFTVYNSAMTALGTVTGSGFMGSTLSFSFSAIEGGTYYIKADGADNTAFGTGRYSLSLGLGGSAAPAPDTTPTPFPNGSPLQGGGGQPEGPRGRGQKRGHHDHDHTIDGYGPAPGWDAPGRKNELVEDRRNDNGQNQAPASAGPSKPAEKSKAAAIVSNIATVVQARLFADLDSTLEGDL